MIVQLKDYRHILSSIDTLLEIKREERRLKLEMCGVIQKIYNTSDLVDYEQIYHLVNQREQETRLT